MANLRSKRYGDVYFSDENGPLNRAMSLFMVIHARLAEREYLLIAETGFGTGLNFLAVVAYSLNSKTKTDFVSVEGSPLSKEKVAAALRAFPNYNIFRAAAATMAAPVARCSPHELS